MPPVVAIVGRPNVGKSRLFNRLVGQRQALVAEQAGLTRDRHYGTAEWENCRFAVVDTGGFEPEFTTPLDNAIREQTQVAIDEADLIVMMLDARTGALGSDHDLLALLRKSGKPVLYVANKVDGPKQDADVAQLYELGISPISAVSAEHGRGFDEFVDALVASLEKMGCEPQPTSDGDGDGANDSIRITLAGRPNAGKSLLLNRLCGSERAIVSELPGTTRDPIDVEVTDGRARYVVVDTAGIRRKHHSSPFAEQIAVMQAMRSLERSDVACLVIDAERGPAQQDARIANLALEAGCGIVVVWNKIDLASGQSDWKHKLEDQRQDALGFIDFAPDVQLSALTGKGVRKVLPTVREVSEQRQRRVATASLNRFLQRLVGSHPPPTHNGRSVNLLYMTQPTTSPPTFVFSANDPEGVGESYRRFLRNELRREYQFAGVPLRLFFRHHHRPR